jgi:multiple sugar transport system ATP-binding protein
MADVVLRNLAKRFGDTQALADLDLSIRDGEFVVLLGPTGAGKTTTLRLIAGLEKPDSGRIEIGGRDVAAEAPAERDVAFVFQQYSLYPHMTVYENLAFPLKAPVRKLSAEEIDRRVREVARMVRIDHKLENRSTRLSGGEMQRVAIGRALVRRPAIYLMDEPLSSLDAKLRAELRLELKRIQKELGSTLLYVTHDQVEAMTMADRIGIVAEGRLMQVGTPREIYGNPANLHVAARLGQPHINLLPADLLPAARHEDHRCAHRTSRHHCRQECQCRNRLDRTSRRPEPSAHQGRQSQARHTCGSISGDRAGRPDQPDIARSALFRRGWTAPFLTGKQT